MEDRSCANKLASGACVTHVSAEAPAPQKATISVCSSCAGSQATLADLEDLCSSVGLKASSSGCMGACGSGPNVMVTTPPAPVEEGQAPNRGTYKLLTGVYSLDKSLSVLEQALGQPPEIPEEIMTRTRLRSDAMRLMNSTRLEEIEKAEELFTLAIEKEIDDPGTFNPNLSADEAVVQQVERLRELRMLRGNTRGSQLLSDFDGAIADFDDVIEEEPEFTRAYMEKAKILRRARKPQEALDCFKKTMELGTTLDPPPKGFGMHKYMITWLERIIDELEERLLEEEAIGSGEFGDGSFDEDASDSGDGSGRWKVEKITGYSADSCVYHLVNNPPATPHPYPNDAWHVNIRFGGTVREYTPISDAFDWEQGRLDIVVKTYTDGQVSKKFAMLRQASPYTSAEEQPCWVLTSVPALTLALPGLTEMSPEMVAMMNPDAEPVAPCSHLAMIVGGTGIAPALQILREVANPEGAFGPSCKGSLLYASHTPEDVLCVDELRELEERSGGRISVRHTLTDFEIEGKEEASSGGTDYWLPGRHYHFTSQWNPYKPESGELLLGEGDEAGLRGRPDEDMLAAQLPPPADGVRVAVCGPPAMWNDMQAALMALGHKEENIIELKALTDDQMREQGLLPLEGSVDTGSIVPVASPSDDSSAAAPGMFAKAMDVIHDWGAEFAAAFGAVKDPSAKL